MEAPADAPPQRDADALFAAAAAAAAAPQHALQMLPAFSCYRYGFRFMRGELALLESVFSATGGATPSRSDLVRMASAFSAAPARMAEPPHPVVDKQIKAREGEPAKPARVWRARGASRRGWDQLARLWGKRTRAPT
jgi:hypothetical protein